MNIDLLPKSRHMERRNGRCKFIGHSYVSLHHYLSKPVHFWIALFVVPCIQHSQECPPYVLKCVSPNPCRCVSTDGFHVWHSTSPSSPPWTFLQCPVKKQAASLTYWYFWHNILFSFNPLTPYIAFTLDSGIIAKKESQEIWHFYCLSPPDLSICWKTWILYATNTIQKQKKLTIILWKD